MIINDFNIKGVTVSPLETNAPLIIDSNAMLPASISRKLLKAIARRYPQVFQDFGCIQDFKFSTSGSLNVTG